MVNPFEETAIAGDISLTPHQRVQQERDLRIDEVANMYGAGNWRDTQQGYDDDQAATRYVDWKYPVVHGDLTAGKHGPFMGGYGAQHRFQRPTSESKGHNVLKHGLDFLFHKVAPKYRDMIGFTQPDWVEEYINRDVPQIDDEMSMLGLPGTEVARSRYKSEYDKAIKKLLDKGMRIKDAIIELAPQWGSQPYKGFNYKMANRGGLMSLV